MILGITQEITQGGDVDRKETSINLDHRGYISEMAGYGQGCDRLRNFQKNCGRLDPPKSGDLTPLHDSRYTCKPIKDFDFER